MDKHTLRREQPLPSWAWLVALLLALLGVSPMAYSAWKVDSYARQMKRDIADFMAQPPRPTPHQRFDALEERVRALEQRLSPSE